jgi:hypothetical protein
LCIAGSFRGSSIHGLEHLGRGKASFIKKRFAALGLQWLFFRFFKKISVEHIAIQHCTTWFRRVFVYFFLRA